jgi:hypothetical protein
LTHTSTFIGVDPHYAERLGAGSQRRQLPARRLTLVGLSAAETRLNKTPVDRPKQKPATPATPEHLIDIAPADRLEQLQDLAQPVETECEENHLFLPAGTILLPTLLLYPEAG